MAALQKDLTALKERPAGGADPELAKAVEALKTSAAEQQKASQKTEILAYARNFICYRWPKSWTPEQKVAALTRIAEAALPAHRRPGRSSSRSSAAASAP